MLIPGLELRSLGILEVCFISYTFKVFSNELALTCIIWKIIQNFKQMKCMHANGGNKSSFSSLFLSSRPWFIAHCFPHLQKFLCMLPLLNLPPLFTFFQKGLSVKEIWPSNSSKCSRVSCRMSEWVKVAQSCPTLCNPWAYTVHGILQARILEWVVFAFCGGSSQSRDWTLVSHTAGKFFTGWVKKEAQEYWRG